MSTSVATAAPPTLGATVYAKKKRTTIIAQFSPELQQKIVQAARSRPGAPTLTTRGGTTQPDPTNSPESDLEMHLTCAGDWFVFWVEDADGNPVMGTINVHCAGQDIPVG